MVTPPGFDVAVSDVKLEALAATQYGVFSRAQALTYVSSDRIHDNVARERWDRPLPRVYRVTAVPRSFRQRAMAASLWSAPDGLIALAAGARLHDLPAPLSLRINVLTADSRRLRHPDINVRRTADLLPADRAVVHGIRCTSALRTVVDLAASLDDDALEVVIEDALRRRMFTIGQLRWRASLRGSGVDGAATIRRLLERQLGNTESTWELRTARVLTASGLAEPLRQHPVDTALGRLHVDLAYPGPPTVVFEYDSDRWHSSAARRHRDAERRNALRLSGCLVIEVTPALLRDPEALVAMARAATSAWVSHPVGTLSAWE